MHMTEETYAAKRLGFDLTSPFGAGGLRQHSRASDRSQVKPTRWRAIARIGLVALLTLPLFSCAGGNAMFAPLTPTTVHASGGPCASGEVFSEATTANPLETNDYLQWPSSECVIATEVTDTYVTTLPHKVQAVDLEMGSMTGTTLEWAFWLKFDWSDAQGPHHIEFFSQYDKHVDNIGNLQKVITLSQPLAIPAGTRLTIHRLARQGTGVCIVQGVVSDGTTFPGCLTGQKIELIGMGQ